MAGAIDVDALMRSGRPTPPFPPDSVVGILEVSDGEQVASFAFLADADQAARAKALPPEPLVQAADVIYSAAAAHLDIDDPKP